MNIKRTFLAVVSACGAFMASAFTTDTVTVETTYLERPMRVTVTKPDVAVWQGVELPTIYLLHGYGGDYKSWTSMVPAIGPLADQYEVIIVMPDGRDSWYFDSPVNPKVKMESFFEKDLVPYIDSHYPTAKEASQRAITGLSMGGHGGLYLGTRHPEIWGNIGSMSGGVNIIPFEKRWKIAAALGEYKTNPTTWEQHTVINMVDKMKLNGQNIIIDCGSEDFFHQVNADLHNKLLEAQVPHEYTSRPGKHNWKYWSNSILYHTMFFSNNFKAAKAKK